MNELPIGLPALPMAGDELAEGAGLEIKLHHDKLCQWSAAVYNSYGDVVDVFGYFSTPIGALTTASIHLPGATFKPPDDAE